MRQVGLGWTMYVDFTYPPANKRINSGDNDDDKGGEDSGEGGAIMRTPAENRPALKHTKSVPWVRLWIEGLGEKLKICSENQHSRCTYSMAIQRLSRWVERLINNQA
jgi:hypothetical protein